MTQKRIALKALIWPAFWCLILAVEVFFVAHKTGLSLPLRLFEDLVFMTSFLFYSSKGLTGYTSSPFISFLASFTLQFAFWWSAGFLILLLKSKIKTR